MTPGARVQAAIDCLDLILSGQPAEQVLTTWGRQNRYAGSKDRAAVRDHVFGALRRRRSAGWIGGTGTGRAVMIGALRLDGLDPADFFTGEGHAPAILTDGVGTGALDEAPGAVRADLPDWLWQRMVADHGAAAEGIAETLRHRAPVWLRVNVARVTRDAAASALAGEEIGTEPHPEVETALRVTANAARVQASAPFRQGWVEMQDAASQAAVLRLRPVAGRVLDYCAGGGGKSLALAALGGAVQAHDGDPRRMADLPARAARAGVKVPLLRDPRGAAPFDLVLVDAPCSGSGTWRRTPDAKWRLTPEALDRLVRLQADILTEAAECVAPGGRLAYATCSVIEAENGGQVAEFAARGGWQVRDELRLLPGALGDGFYLAVLERG